MATFAEVKREQELDEMRAMREELRAILSLAQVAIDRESEAVRFSDAKHKNGRII